MNVGRLTRLSMLALLVMTSTAFAAAQGTNGTVNQTLSFSASPTALPAEGKPRGLSLSVSGELENAADPDGLPDTPTRIELDLDDDITYGGGRFPACSQDLEDTTPEEARERCPGKSHVGGGSATVRATFGGGTADLPAEITLFKAPDRGALPAVLVHVYVPAAARGGAGEVAVERSVKGDDFGLSLALDVPDLEMPGVEASVIGLTLEAGATLKKTKIKKRKNGKRKKVVKRFAYVAGRCTDDDRRLDLAARFEYSGAGPIELTDRIRCRVR